VSIVNQLISISGATHGYHVYVTTSTRSYGEKLNSCFCDSNPLDMEETKVIYYVDEEETPYLMKIGQSPGKVTLADFKGQLNRPYHKFFFKSVDDDFG